MYKNDNRPALWMLNAKIPRTGQYVKQKECSCWDSGCGEFDLFEVLDSGNHRCLSAVHATGGITPPEWFRRPTDKLIKVAVVLNDGKGHIKVLDDSAEFPESFSNTDLENLCTED